MSDVILKRVGVIVLISDRGEDHQQIQKQSRFCPDEYFYLFFLEYHRILKENCRDGEIIVPVVHMVATLHTIPFVPNVIRLHIGDLMAKRKIKSF